MARDSALHLRHAPIVEAVFDADCDLPPGFDLAALAERSRRQFEDAYPKFRTQFLQEHKIEVQADAPPTMSVVHRAVQAFQHRQDDDRQLVQVRAHGFSFNRLAPYSNMDDYLPEIERTWRLYVDLAAPVEVRVIRLRYINRIPVPLAANTVDLDEYFTAGPRLPDEERLRLSGFLSQQVAVDKDTGHEVNLVLTAQAPEQDKLPVILDITVGSAMHADPADWPALRAAIGSLRRLKNRIFEHSLTPKCIQLFQS
jgi:uncharacterized protein (TIGR04255 family)